MGCGGARMGQGDGESLQDSGVLGLQRPPTTKADTHQLCAGSPAHPSLLEPVAKPSPHSLSRGPLGGRPSLPTPQMKSTALGMLGRLSKKRFNMLLTARLPRASDVCAPQDSPALYSPPLLVSRFKSTLPLFPYFLGRKSAPASLRGCPKRGEWPLQKATCRKALRAPKVTCQCVPPAPPSSLPSSPLASSQQDFETSRSRQDFQPGGLFLSAGAINPLTQHKTWHFPAPQLML